MAQHVLQFAFSFDDEKVTAIAEQTVEKECNKIVKDIILDQLAPKETTWYKGPSNRDWSNFYERVDNLIEDILNEHKDEIIELAANKLVDNYKRTKAWKEKAGEVLK